MYTVHACYTCSLWHTRIIHVLYVIHVKLYACVNSVLVPYNQGSHFLECQGKSGNFVLTGMSGNCQGILTYVREFLWKVAMPISAFAFHCAGPMGRQDHYDLRG